MRNAARLIRVGKAWTEGPEFIFQIKVVTTRVPRYYFNFESDFATAADMVGRNFPEHEAAKREGAKLAADVGTTGAVDGQLPAFDWLEVLDEMQRPVTRLPVAAAIREPNRSS